jgi:Domain of Unknown Function (DUF1080)
MFGKIGSVVVVLSATVQAVEPQQLFNGRNFDGWALESISTSVKPENVWSVVDGIIICKGRPPGVLRTTREFANYELIVEWRWSPSGKPGNSGVLIHASQPKELFAWPKSIEVQLGHENAGDFWEIGETLVVATAKPLGRRWVKKGDSHEKPPGEWNRARIRCQGNTVTVWINDILANEATELSTAKGAICLQSEEHEVQFRKVELTALD